MTMVDSLRGIAATAVIVRHTVGLWVAGVPSNDVAAVARCCFYGMHGVDVFFVISGFVIAHSVGRNFVDWSYIGRFALRRSIRLDPPYWCAIVLGLTTLAVQRHFGRVPDKWPSNAMILLHFVYLQDVFHMWHIVGVFWTLCIEVQFYLVFVLLLGAVHSLRANAADEARRDQFTVRVIVFAYFISLIWPLGMFGDEWVSTWFVYQWHKFLLGALISLSAARRIRMRTLTICVCTYFVVAVSRHWLVSSPSFGATPGIWVACGTAVLLSVGVAREALYRWLAWKPMLRVGAISYSLYLLHSPIMDVLMGVQSRVAPGSLIGAAIFVILGVSLSLLSAWMLYSLVELPSLRLSAKLKPRPVVSRTSVACAKKTAVNAA